MAEVGRGEQGVQHDLETVVEHFGDDSREERAADLEARVRVHFDQVQAEVLVNHEIVTE